MLADQVVTIPHSAVDVVVRVYTGIFKVRSSASLRHFSTQFWVLFDSFCSVDSEQHADAIFNATLRDHTGKELANIGHKWGATTGGVVNQVFTVQVAPAKTQGAPPRTLEVAWSQKGRNAGSNIQFQSVAVSSQNATADDADAVVAEAAPPPSFVILQAAQLK